MKSYLASIADSIESQPYYARIGCELTEIQYAGGFSGATRTFDAAGRLVGYASYGDSNWGPCNDFNYRRGLYLDGCSEVRECLLAPDGGETGELCRCSCPSAPPPDGIVEDDAECVSIPHQGIACPPMLVDWGHLGLQETPPNGIVRRDCGQKVVEIDYGDDVIGCIYDADEKLVGSQRRTTTSTGCDGVDGWRNGVRYVSCAEERPCWFGETPPNPDLPKCGYYPYH